MLQHLRVCDPSKHDYAVVSGRLGVDPTNIVPLFATRSNISGSYTQDLHKTLPGRNQGCHPPKRSEEISEINHFKLTSRLLRFYWLNTHFRFGERCPLKVNS